MSRDGAPPEDANPTLAPDSFDAFGEPPRSAPPQPPPERYTDLERIGEGGTAEVLRALDTQLGRTVARKVVKPALVDRPSVTGRFVEEARLTARLDHPGIVPVHELGQFPDGRRWFTMKEVRGRTLTALIRALHDSSPADAWGETPDGWTLARMVDALRRVCEAVGYAHARGVVHRDLKPDNVMVGAFGEVVVMDWGLARAGDGPPPEAMRTMIAGTPAFMSPEQAAGRFEALDSRSDVYALGGLLYAILYGGPPFAGRDLDEVLAKVRRGLARPLPAGRPVPDELRELLLDAMADDPADRPADAGALAERLRLWQEGAQRRERAAALLVEARTLLERVEGQAETLEAERAALQARARDLPAWAPVTDKRALWRDEDALEARLVKAEADRTRGVELLRLALSEDPALTAARTLLADRFAAALLRAEQRRDTREAGRLAELLRATDPARHARHMALGGRLTLHTDVPAAARLMRVVSIDRRLVPRFERALGETPLVDVPLEPGSWVVELRAPGRATVRYPVAVGRGEHWDGIPPDGGAPVVLRLPATDAIGRDDVVVPAGWFRAGGDPAWEASGPERRVWVDAFVIRRHPVTNTDFLAFLDDLVAQGRADQADRHVPRWQRPTGQLQPPVYDRGADGRHRIVPDSDGDIWQADWPVFLIERSAAEAYASWLASRTGLPWRLPWELEREKAARGVDGRSFPWGDHMDASFGCIRGGTQGRALPAGIGAHPFDASPYGVRGMAGNVQDWCLDAWDPAAARVSGGRLVRQPVVGDGTAVARGGAWSFGASASHAAFRIGRPSASRRESLGFRLVRSLP